MPKSSGDGHAGGGPEGPDHPDVVGTLLEGEADSAVEGMLGIRLVSVGRGWVEVEMTVAAGASADDPFPSGFLGVLADVALGRAVLTTAADTGGCRTASLRLDFTDVAFVEGEVLAARGEVLAQRDALTLAAADIRTGDGRLAARASGWFVVLSGGDGVAPTDAEPGGATNYAATPHPRASLARLRELVRFRADVGGPDGGGRSERTGGTGRTERTELSVEVRREMANRHKVMHGGMQAALGEAALSFVAARAARGSTARVVGLDVTLLRPVAVDGSRLRASADLVRAGRRVLVAEAAFLSPDDRPLISVVGTFALSASDIPSGVEP